MKPRRSVLFIPGQAEVYGALRETGLMNGECSTSLLDSGALIYDVYECADGKYVSVSPVEQQFSTCSFRNSMRTSSWACKWTCAGGRSCGTPSLPGSRLDRGPSG
jgi:hypothetical protein